jgi:predicted site-specific integrase-resolvase
MNTKIVLVLFSMILFVSMATVSVFAEEKEGILDSETIEANIDKQNEEKAVLTEEDADQDDTDHEMMDPGGDTFEDDFDRDFGPDSQ